MNPTDHNGPPDYPDEEDDPLDFHNFGACMLNMLELAMKARHAGDDDLAFKRFSTCLPYFWTRTLTKAEASEVSALIGPRIREDPDLLGRCIQAAMEERERRLSCP